MPRLIETKEPIPEYSTVINWTVPVYIKNGEDYYKVCFDIKRKPLSDGTLPMTDGELDSLAKILDTHKIYGVRLIFEKLEYKDYEGYCYYHEIVNIKAIAYLLERFELIKED